MRTPDEMRLKNLAEFFEVSVEYLRRDNRPKQSADEAFTVLSAGVTLQQNVANRNISEMALLPGAPSMQVNDVIWNCHKVFSGYTDDGDQVLLECKVKLVRKPRTPESAVDV